MWWGEAGPGQWGQQQLVSHSLGPNLRLTLSPEPMGQLLCPTSITLVALAREGLPITEDTLWANSQSHHKIGGPQGHQGFHCQGEELCRLMFRGCKVDGWGETGSGAGWVVMGMAREVEFPQNLR